MDPGEETEWLEFRKGKEITFERDRHSMTIQPWQMDKALVNGEWIVLK